MAAQPSKICLKSILHEGGNINTVFGLSISKLFFLAPEVNYYEIFCEAIGKQSAKRSHLECIHTIISNNFKQNNAISYRTFFLPKFDKKIKKSIDKTRPVIEENEKRYLNHPDIKSIKELGNYSESITNIFLVFYINYIIMWKILYVEEIMEFIRLVMLSKCGNYQHINSVENYRQVNDNYFNETFLFFLADSEKYTDSWIVQKDPNTEYYLNFNMFDLYLKHFITNFHNEKYNFKKSDILNKSSIDSLLNDIKNGLGQEFFTVFDCFGNRESNAPILNLIMDKSHFVYRECDKQISERLKPFLLFLFNCSDDFMDLFINHAITHINIYNKELISIINLSKLPSSIEKRKIMIFKI